jgi:endonuclease YncB( thermonuclease family)
MRNRGSGSGRSRRKLWRAAGVIVALGLLALVQMVWRQMMPLPAGVVSGTAHVIDGDSLRIGHIEIRLKGIDAPEGRQTCERDRATWRCGDAAASELRHLTQGGDVSCRIVEKDQFGRSLAFCEGEGRDINRALVLSGAAIDYGHYRQEEAEARAAKRGLWAGTFERPRDWRRRNGGGG